MEDWDRPPGTDRIPERGVRGMLLHRLHPVDWMLRSAVAVWYYGDTPSWPPSGGSLAPSVPGLSEWSQEQEAGLSLPDLGGGVLTVVLGWLQVCQQDRLLDRVRRLLASYDGLHGDRR